MLDLLFLVTESLLDSGVSRKAGFAASLVALATATGILLMRWQTPTARIVMVACAVAAVLIVLFSTVDIVKEPGPSRLWSISSDLAGAATLMLASYMLFR